MLVHRGNQLYTYESLTGKLCASAEWALYEQPGTRLSLSSVTHVLTSLREDSYFMSAISRKFIKNETHEGQVDIASVP